MFELVAVCTAVLCTNAQIWQFDTSAKCEEARAVMMAQPGASAMICKYKFAPIVGTTGRVVAPGMKKTEAGAAAP